MVHTRSWINIFVCTWYIHVHECKYMYGHSADTSLQLHNYTSLSIRPYQLCDASESQLSTGSAPSEEPPSCHQSSCIYIVLTLFITVILVCTLYILVCHGTCYRHVHPVQCLYMVHLCSSWFTSFCWKHFLDVCRLYSLVLGCTTFKQWL